MKSTAFEPTAKFLREHFVRFGVPNVIESDGGPPFNSYEWKKFLEAWNIRHRLSSAMYPESNSRAEIGVKVAKRLIANNSDNGDIDRDEVSRALLQYLNTPLQGLSESPAQIVFGRRIKCSLPALPTHAVWRAQRDAREIGMARLKVENLAKLNKRPNKNLAPLAVGQTVNVQNQTGSKPLRWDRTGVVTEVGDHRQYSIRMDGSGRLSLRNRKFLRPTTPLHVDQLRPAVSTWTQLPPGENHPDPTPVDSVTIAEEAAPVPAPDLEQTIASSPPTPARMEQTPRRTMTPVPRRVADRITAADASALKDKRIRIGPEETGSIPTPAPAQPTRQSKRLRKPPAKLDIYDLSTSLVIHSSTWSPNHCK